MQKPLRRLSVAPMEGITNFPMRLWLHLVSQPSSMTTPFLRVTRVFPEKALPRDFAPELLELRGILPYELIPQYISGDPSQFLRACELLPEDVAPLIEINCGCPSPNSLGKLAGSGMLHDPQFFGKSIAFLSRSLGDGRLAVKMRLGMESPEEFPDLLHSISDLPLGRLTVHARTRRQGYRGLASWDALKLTTQTISPSVLASGDVLGMDSLQKLEEFAPHIHGAMIGRGVLRNPWIFEELRSNAPVKIQGLTLINALFCYALLQELWQTNPQKLLNRIKQGRIGSACLVDFAAWEKLTVELTGLIFGVPFLLTRSDDLVSKAISSVAMGRLRLVWSYFRSSLPADFAAPAIMRSKHLEDFFGRIFQALTSKYQLEDQITVGHQTEWDVRFAGARG
ncbi:MAG: tRNA-dihydrouridine synthase family protein [Oligoflexus sp.]